MSNIHTIVMLTIPLQVFQCLLIEGENVGPEAKRNALTFIITMNSLKDSFSNTSPFHSWYQNQTT